MWDLGSMEGKNQKGIWIYTMNGQNLYPTKKEQLLRDQILR